MGEKKTKYEGILKYKGTFNFHGFYDKIFSSLREMLYEVKEKKFKQATGDEDFEVEFEITAEKKVDIDFKYVIDVEVKTGFLSLEATNPDNEGTTYGIIQMIWKAESEYDYQGRFKDGVNKHIGKMYKFLKNPKDKPLRGEALQFEKEIKRFLNMEFDKE